MSFFLGGYTPSLHTVELNPADGSMKIAGSVETPENASFLCYVPEFSALYATVETGSRREESGTVAAFHVGDSGQLDSIGTVESCGPGPCHIAVNAAERVLTVANYVGGNFALYDLGDDGRPRERRACVQHSGSSVNA
ncbi:MAG: beta-propeller fold lactonase family protein, partial [Nitriliruptoraceae bacterium]